MSDTSHVGADIKELANLLRLRRSTGNRTVLLLGSRVGGLFRSELFYEHLERFSNRDFGGMSRFEQFSECYALLTASKRFGESDIHGICRIALQDVAVTDADIYLAELIKKGFFEEVVSTNIDGVMERALSQVGMTEGKDFDVYTTHREKLREKSISCRITKVSGDFVSRDYTIINKRLLHNEHNQKLEAFLKPILERDLLVVGIDPVWDEEILNTIPTQAETMWFVSEEDLAHQPRISSILRGRSATIVSEKAGRFDNFMQTLYENIYGDASSAYKSRPDTWNHLLDNTEAMPYLNQLHDILEKLQILQRENQQILSEIRKIKDKLEDA
jgi:hypothetical protein